MLGDGTAKFFLGTAVGAACGFAAGALASTPTVRSVGQSAVGGLGSSVRFLGRRATFAINGLGVALESGYTRVRGREKYLEHEIEELREQITRLEQKMD